MTKPKPIASYDDEPIPEGVKVLPRTFHFDVPYVPEKKGYIRETDNKEIKSRGLST